MTELNIIKKVEKMNTTNKTEPSLEAEILKFLLTNSGKTSYQVNMELTERLKDKPELNVNYPTLKRKVSKLENEGYVETKASVKKNGSTDKRLGKELFLTFKGLAFIIVKVELEESEIRRLFQDIADESIKHGKDFNISGSLSTQQIPITTLEKSLKELRPRINLDCFEEEYVKGLIFKNVIIENCLNELTEWRKQALPNLDHKSRKEKKVLYRQARKKAVLISPELEKLVFVYDYMRNEREEWNKKIGWMGPIVRQLQKLKKKH